MYVPDGVCMTSWEVMSILSTYDFILLFSHYCYLDIISAAGKNRLFSALFELFYIFDMYGVDLTKELQIYAYSLYTWKII